MRRNGMALMQALGRQVEAGLLHGLGKQAGELLLDLAQVDAVLRALGSGQAGRDVGKIQPHDL